MLYEAATDTNPFDTESGDERAQLSLRAPAIRTVRRLPTAVGTMIDACLEPDPHDRPSLEEISALLAPLPRMTTETPP